MPPLRMQVATMCMVSALRTNVMLGINCMAFLSWSVDLMDSGLPSHLCVRKVWFNILSLYWLHSLHFCLLCTCLACGHLVCFSHGWLVVLSRSCFRSHGELAVSIENMPVHLLESSGVTETFDVLSCTSPVSLTACYSNCCINKTWTNIDTQSCR